MKKAKIPKSYIQAKINAGIQAALEKRGNADYRRGYEDASNDTKATCNAAASEKINQLRIEKENLNSHIDALNADLTESERQLKQKDAHYKYQVDKLTTQIEHLQQKVQTHENLPVPFVNNNLFVHNWRDGWKWLSTQCFALIVFFATVPIPSEVLAVLPENVRLYVVAFIAFCGVVGRHLNQSKGVQQWLSKS